MGNGVLVLTGGHKQDIFCFDDYLQHEICTRGNTLYLEPCDTNSR